MISELFDEAYFPSLTPSGEKRKETVSVQGIRSKTDVKSYGLAYAYNFLRCEAGLMPNLSGDKKNLIQEDFYKQTSLFPKDFFLSHDVAGVNPQNFENLPQFSWFLSVDIRLEEPFLSRGDDPFYPLENSVCRDAASGLPMVKATTWKGNFLDAAFRLCPVLLPHYFAELTKCTDADWQAKENVLDSLSNPRIAGIMTEHGGLKNCPLYALEELYRIVEATEREKQKKPEQKWFALRKRAHKIPTERETYLKHPLTILHQLRGDAIGWLNRLCGTDDAIYTEVATGNRHKYFHLPITDNTDLALDQTQLPCRGHLCFFPSYFTEIGFDVLAPVERMGRTVTHPIPIEIIPKNSSSTFCLFYLATPETTAKMAAKDLSFCLDIVETMLQETGFSAKKNTGYGQAKILACDCQINHPNWQSTEMEQDSPFQPIPRFLAFFSKVERSVHLLEKKEKTKVWEEYLTKKVTKFLEDKLKPKERKQLKTRQEKLQYAKTNGFKEEEIQSKFEKEWEDCDTWWDAEKKKYPKPQPRQISTLHFTTIAELMQEIQKFWRIQP